MEERVQKLKKEIELLLKWKADNERQQFTLKNFGNLSRKIAYKDKLVFTGKLFDDTALVYPYTLEMKLNDAIYLIPVEIET